MQIFRSAVTSAHIWGLPPERLNEWLLFKLKSSQEFAGIPLSLIRHHNIKNMRSFKTCTDKLLRNVDLVAYTLPLVAARRRYNAFM